MNLRSDIIISDNESDNKSCVSNCEMEIQKEQQCSNSREN